MTRDEVKKVAAWIREARERRGLTQADVAIKVDRSQPWVSQVERATAVPSKHEILAIAVAVDADALEAIELGGFLQTPPWARRMDAKLDEILARLPNSRVDVGGICRLEHATSEWQSVSATR